MKLCRCMCNFLIMIYFIHTSSCCHDGGKEMDYRLWRKIKVKNFLSITDIWIPPDSQIVSLGESATFFCYGDGSYLYWFINGVNTENITDQEITDRGLSFSGYYNHYPPYMYGCDIQYAYMTMTGNCLNNNSEIYCVVLGSYPPPLSDNATSAIVTLTVEGIYKHFINT